MSLRESWSRTKGKFKKQLGISRDEHGSASSSSLREPSPGPQATRPAATPQSTTQSSVAPANISSPTHNLTPASTTFASTLAEPHDPAPPSALAEHLSPVQTSGNARPHPDSHSANAGIDAGRGGSTAWTGLRSLLKVIEAGAGAFTPLSLAINGLDQCIGIFEQASNSQKDYEELQANLDSLLGDLSQFLCDEAYPIMTKSITNLSASIQREVELIKGKSERNALQRHIEAPDQAEEIMECYRRIQGHLDRLAASICLNANLGIWNAVNRLTEGLRDTRLQRLSPSLSALYDSAKSSSVQRRRCTPGTRISEIDKLITWAHNPQGQNVFWMNGMAGTGKTTIAYSVCTELDKEAALGASFFCSRSIPECRDVHLIIPAIAYQLAQFSYPFRCAVSKVLETESDVYARVLEKQFDSLLVKPLLEVKHALPEDIVVVIDALDECDNEESVAHILSILLPPTPDMALPLRFLISSRPDPAIYSHMTAQVGDSLSARLVLHDLDDQAVKGDIATYLRDELRDISLTPTQLTGLVERAGVLFIFASTACRYIKAGVRLKSHQKRLDMILGLVPASTGSNDRDIDMLYTPILSAALESRDLDDDDKALMKALLDAVICLQEPMTVNALAGLLELDGGERVEALLRPLSSVLNISERNGLVTTLHASFPNFMLDSRRSHLLHCDLAASHLRLMAGCFGCIQTNPRQFNVCELQSSHARDEDVVGLVERTQQAISFELFYSCRYWISHAMHCSKQDVERPLLGFLSSRLLLWMEVLNLKKSMNLGPQILQRTETWNRSSNGGKETIDLIHDTWRFVSMFAGNCVSQSTPHIYISLLPFWPTDSPISRCYAKQVQRGVKVQGTAMTRRQLTNLATWTFDSIVEVACFSPDSSLIAYAIGSSARVIDGSTRSVVSGPFEHGGTVNSVAFSPDGTLLASGCEDKTVQVWGIQSGNAVIDPLTGHTDSVGPVCFTPDGKHIVSGSRDHTIRVWDWRNRQTVLGPLEGHTRSVISVCVSPDGARIASGSSDWTACLWDTRTGEMLLEPFKEHSEYVRSVCFSPDGARIVSGSDDCTIRIWSAQTGQQLAEPFEGHAEYVMSAAFSPDGKKILSASWDSTIRLWDADSRSGLVQQFEEHTDGVNSAEFSPDGARIVSCSNDQTIRVWDARSKAVVDTPLEAHTQSVSSVCFSHDGTRILSASFDRTIRAWDARSGDPLLKPLEGDSNRNSCACFSPDGTRIAAGSADHTIQLWDSETGQPAGEPLAGHSDDVNALCFSPDGTLIVSGSDDQSIRVWSAPNWNAAAETLTGHTSWVSSVCFSPDGARIVSGSGDRTVRVWDVATGQVALGPLDGHTDTVYSVCFSPDGTRIASASRDETIQLWDSSTGKTVCDPLEGQNGGVFSVCFAPTGEFIASGCYDQTIRLWDAHTGATIGILPTEHASIIWSIAFSPDGKQIVSGSQDATIRVFDVSDLPAFRSKASPSLPSDKDLDAPNFDHPPWVLQEDGWVVDAQSRLLAWVPLDLHTRLLRPRNTLLICPTGSVKIKLDHNKLGEGWTGCYKP